MRRLIVAFVFSALVAATATTADAAPQLVMKVDRVTATIVNNQLVVTAEGGVNSGGWTLPRLQLNPIHIAAATAEVIEFQASPPLDNSVVIQETLPVITTAVFPLPHYGVTQVTVVGATNSVTAPIQVR